MAAFEINTPEMPKMDFIMHSKVELMSPEQAIHAELMFRLNDLIAIAMNEHVERTTGKYQTMLYTEFLECVYHAVHNPTAECDRIIFDDFVSVAKFCIPALKHIAAFPSTQLVKIVEKKPVSSLHETGSKTMTWLSRRSGRTMAEKIAPENKVLMNVTHFTTDTKENRHTVYLYRILSDIIYPRWKDCQCVNCKNADTCLVPTREIRELLNLRSKMIHGELEDVPAVRQSESNNKLMCDKYYKMVWDGTSKITQLEKKIASMWKNLEARYFQFAYWVVLAELLHNSPVVIQDFCGRLDDTDEKFEFKQEGSEVEHYQEKALIYPFDSKQNPFAVVLRNGRIYFGRLNTAAENRAIKPELMIDLKQLTVERNLQKESSSLLPQSHAEIAKACNTPERTLPEKAQPDSIEKTQNLGKTTLKKEKHESASNAEKQTSDISLLDDITSDPTDTINLEKLMKIIRAMEEECQLLEQKLKSREKELCEAVNQPIKQSHETDALTKEDFSDCVGNHYVFGIHGDEEIDWVAFDNDETTVKLISCNVIDCCLKKNARNVLNNVYDSFLPAQQNAIKTNSETGDIISLPDETDLQKLSDLNIKMGIQTPYAKEHGSRTSKTGFCAYWLSDLLNVCTGGGHVKSKLIQMPFGIRPVVVMKRSEIEKYRR